MAWSKTGNIKGVGITALTKATNQANSTVTPADVVDLVYAVTASTRFFFEAVLFYTAAAATTGIGVGVNGPVGSSLIAGVLISTSATAVQNGIITTLDGNVQGTAGLTTALMVTVRGTILVGATAGNLAMRFRSEVAGSAVNVLAGSHLKVWN